MNRSVSICCSLFPAACTVPTTPYLASTQDMTLCYKAGWRVAAVCLRQGLPQMDAALTGHGKLLQLC